jgi:hypothetical protein
MSAREITETCSASHAAARWAQECEKRLDAHFALMAQVEAQRLPIEIDPHSRQDVIGRSAEWLVMNGFKIVEREYRGGPAKHDPLPDWLSSSAIRSEPTPDTNPPRWCCLCDAKLKGDDLRHVACWPCRSRLSDAEPLWLRIARWLVR